MGVPKMHTWERDAELDEGLQHDGDETSGSEPEYEEEELARGKLPVKRRANGGDGRRVRRKPATATFEKFIAQTVKAEAEKRVIAAQTVWLSKDPDVVTTIECLLGCMKARGETRPICVWLEAFGFVTLLAKIRTGEKSYVNAGYRIGIYLEKPVDPSPQLSTDPAKVMQRWLNEMFEAAQPKVSEGEFLAECMRKLDAAAAAVPSAQEMRETIGNPAAGMSQAEVIAMISVPPGTKTSKKPVKQLVAVPVDAPSAIIPPAAVPPPVQPASAPSTIVPPAAVPPPVQPADELPVPPAPLVVPAIGDTVALTADDLLPDAAELPSQSSVLLTTLSILCTSLSQAKNQRAVHDFLAGMSKMLGAVEKLDAT